MFKFWQSFQAKFSNYYPYKCNAEQVPIILYLSKALGRKVHRGFASKSVLLGMPTSVLIKVAIVVFASICLLYLPQRDNHTILWTIITQPPRFGPVLFNTQSLIIILLPINIIILALQGRYHFFLTRERKLYPIHTYYTSFYHDLDRIHFFRYNRDHFLLNDSTKKICQQYFISH